MALDNKIPFVGFHTRIADKESVPNFVKLIEEGLAPLGINNIILEFNPGYKYECFPQYSTGTFGKEEALILRKVCEKAGIRIIPMFQCLSHQSNFSPEPWPLFKEHPEFLETPNIPKDAKWPQYYNHSWCASNDGVYDYVFPMIDELISVFECDIIHIGMDEVFDIADADCPRCAGKKPADLFLRTVNILHKHITSKGLEVMMWGDRLIEARGSGYSVWDADAFGMFECFDKIPKDIIINDWHYYDNHLGYPSLEQFHKGGFRYIPASYTDEGQAQGMWWKAMDAIYMGDRMRWDGQMMGFLCTQWDPMTPAIADAILKFIKGEEVENPPPLIKGVSGVIKTMIPLAVKTPKGLLQKR